MRLSRSLSVAALATLAGLAAVPACAAGLVQVVAAENFYGDLATQIGGSHVAVTSVLSNPDDDPHLFESSPSTARLLAAADIVISNGVDYDPWMDKLLSASTGTARTVIVAADLVGK
ncbi:MAG TPA: zinc ABC transporter substrate-binding protein, partial [Devosia sp.]|nr:zinc ABC transporter substrate-binding protein [Devosia sp.]